MQKPHPHAPKRLQYAWEHEQHLKNAHPAEYARLQNSGDNTPWYGRRWLRCGISIPPMSARVKVGHSAMSARCPVCPKADTTGRFMRSRPKLLARADEVIE
jgi:hypothetical protein